MGTVFGAAPNVPFVSALPAAGNRAGQLLRFNNGQGENMYMWRLDYATETMRWVKVTDDVDLAGKADASHGHDLGDIGIPGQGLLTESHLVRRLPADSIYNFAGPEAWPDGYTSMAVTSAAQGYPDPWGTLYSYRSGEMVHQFFVTTTSHWRRVYRSSGTWYGWENLVVAPQERVIPLVANSLVNSSGPALFPFGISTMMSTGGLGGFPAPSGTLVTASMATASYTGQTFYGTNGETFTRSAVSFTSWGPWYGNSPLPAARLHRTLSSNLPLLNPSPVPLNSVASPSYRFPTSMATSGSTSANPGRITVPVDGIYHIDWFLWCTGTQGTVRGGYVMLNGSQTTIRVQTPVSTGSDLFGNGGDLRLVAGDRLELWSSWNGGGNMPVSDAWMSAHLVRPL